jgi:murein L,D-transpeptidase YcbB/YkuD
MRTLAVLVAGAATLLPARTLVAQGVAPALRARLQGEHREALLARVYDLREFRPSWVTDSGPSSRARELLDRIDAAGDDGLDPRDYPTDAVRALLSRAAAADSFALLELQLTRLLLAYGRDLARGRIDPAATDSSWTRAPSSLDLAAAVGAVLDATPLAAALSAMAPPQPQYALLRGALARYREALARGGWRAVRSGPDLALGARGPRVAALRARLEPEGDLTAAAPRPEVYDSALEEGVRRFQARHGLAADGVAGAGTLAALNVPAAERVRQIELNLERWRWLPRDLGDRYVMVNSAAFTLEVRDHGRRVMEMPVIVGRPDWPTPIASGRITALVFSPVWDIPPAIASQEVVPLIRRDSTYIARHGITVFRDSGEVLLPVDPVTVDWSSITESTFTLRLKQAPGYDNPLGAVKAVFGSRFNVCLHDTPVRASFQERVRTFSHGCVRVARAAELATYLLDDSLRWSGDSVQARMAARQEEPVYLERAIPAYLTYWTAWVDEDGVVQFRDDIYGWDRKLARALATRPRPLS